MIALQYWLYGVAALRLFNVVLGYLGPKYFKERVYTLATDEVSALAARLFSVWTALTCACCIVCAAYIEERGIFIVTYASFIIALAFFGSEAALYKTVTFRFLSVIGFVTSMCRPDPTTRALFSSRSDRSVVLCCVLFVQSLHWFG